MNNHIQDESWGLIGVLKEKKEEDHLFGIEIRFKRGPLEEIKTLKVEEEEEGRNIDKYFY